jgi:O-acetyl-ADP-ribose deacetylase (regulator of RNase III)
MSRTSVSNRLALVEGDITKQRVDAIVNAANNSLLGGGGVDGAIHRAAGPEWLAEYRARGGCATGQAKITCGYQLPARWVIHTVGPVWRDGHHAEAEQLARCYRYCFALIEQHGIKTAAFPSLSTSAYGFRWNARPKSPGVKQNISWNIFPGTKRFGRKTDSGRFQRQRPGDSSGRAAGNLHLICSRAVC